MIGTAKHRMLSLESPSNRPGSRSLSNAEIADRLASLAQLLSTQKENPYKIKAYARAAAKIRTPYGRKIVFGDRRFPFRHASLGRKTGFGDGRPRWCRGIAIPRGARRASSRGAVPAALEIGRAHV